VIGEDGAAAHAGKGALRAGRDLADVVVIADAGEDDLGAFGGLRRRRARGAAIFLDPGLRLGRRAVVDGDLMARFGKMPRHRIPHHAQPEECQLHIASPPFARHHASGDSMARKSALWRRAADRLPLM